jgi:catechol 2,3-dioxygenase
VSPALPPETTVGPVHLTVADLPRSLRYYEHVLGLRPAANGERPAGSATLGAGGDDLLVLVEEPGARPAPQHTGLFHYAVVVPDRADLAAWLGHVLQERIPLTGLSDHIVSEAIYLRDPDGHGIEVYRDRPSDQWEREGEQVRMVSDPLDVPSLLGAQRGGPATLPPGSRMGHVHLQVADIPATEAFYRDVLGFDKTAVLGDQASFFSAGGYHHHIGANTWAGRGATPPPPGAAALRQATILLPDAAERDRAADRAADAGAEPEEADGGILVRDPSANGLLLAVR